ncbi:MAG: hypothetical protein M3Z25_05180 [Actinomycetota bacterium]|nr:hypothetical protein [Actinomycetota bacterium]
MAGSARVADDCRLPHRCPHSTLRVEQPCQPTFGRTTLGEHTVGRSGADSATRRRTADVHVSRAVLGHLSTVRLARQDGYDRLVLEFTDQVPGYTVGYRPLPVRADASGAEIPLPGATTAVVVTLHPASGHREDTGAPTYTGPATVAAGTAQVTQAQAAGDFEAVLNWVVGLRAKTPFRVTVLGGPPRLVIDFQH